MNTVPDSDHPSPESRDSDGPKSRSLKRRRFYLVITGAALAVLAWYIYADLFRDVIPYIGKAETMAAAAALGGFAGPRRGRRVLWGFAVGAVFLVLFLGFSPFVPMVMRGLLRSDPLEPAPAVVILAAGVDRRGVMSSAARSRLDRGLEILGQGYSDRMVLTEPRPFVDSWVPVVKRRLRDIGLSYPIDSVGPVINTHDEALQVARLVKQRGWSHVLLVTHPWHMRRAAAVFEKAGVRVVCAPCDEIDFDPLGPKLGRARLNAFRAWAHEAAAILEYRLKGWID